MTVTRSPFPVLILFALIAFSIAVRFVPAEPRTVGFAEVGGLAYSTGGLTCPNCVAIAAAKVEHPELVGSGTVGDPLRVLDYGTRLDYVPATPSFHEQLASASRECFAIGGDALRASVAFRMTDLAEAVCSRDIRQDASHWRTEVVFRRALIVDDVAPVRP